MEKVNAKELYEKGTSYQFENPEIKLGPWTSYSLMNDPKHMCFVLSRYKFCAKMLEGGGQKRNILEVGCGDGFGLPIVADVADKLWAVDWDERLLENIKGRLSHLKNVEYKHIDFNQETSNDLGNIDAVYAIDVIEHIAPDNEEIFMKNIIQCITNKEEGIMILGTPNITASQYASERSAVQHCNLKSMKTLRELMGQYFHNVFMFGMNDEVLHTGYDAMCHYIFAVGAGLK